MTGGETLGEFRRQAERSTCRLLHFGVGYEDLRRSLAAGEWTGFGERLAARAEQLAALGRKARLRGQHCSARDAWLAAAAYYHFAAFKLARGERRDALERSCRDAYARAAPLLAPPAQRLELGCGGCTFPGYLRVAAGGAPCVVLINGLDSVKEVELHRFAEGFLDRGCSTFYFDGPGQGEGADRPIPLSRFHHAVSAALDTLGGELGAAAFGLFGVSFGGHLACAAAAHDRRVAACVSLGGFFDGRIVRRLPPPALANLRSAYGLAPEVPLEVIESLVNLDRSPPLERPLLIVHGGRDHLVDREQVHLLCRWASDHRMLLFDDAEHVCTDHFAEALPAIWDWMSSALASSREAPREVAS